MTDSELFGIVRKELFTALCGDVMDAMGRTCQFLPPWIRPLKEEMVIVGRAMPVLEADCCGTRVGHKDSDEPFGLIFEALDSLEEGEVYICTGSSPSYALWGGLMTMRASYLKAAGAVVDGYTRDTSQVLERGLPVFSRGSYAQDQGQRGRAVDYRCPIRFSNGVTVEPGDLVFGDDGGVVIIPRSVENEVLERALEKSRGEDIVAREISEGMSTVEAFKKYGIM